MENKFKQTLIALKEALHLKESTKVSYKNYKDEKVEATLTGDIEYVHDFLLANDFDFVFTTTHNQRSTASGKTIKIAHYTREENGHDYDVTIRYMPESGKLDSAVFSEDYEEDTAIELVIKSVNEFKEKFVAWAVDNEITDLFNY